MRKTTRQIPGGLASVLLVLLLGASSAVAAPIAVQFTFIGVEGPLAGVSSNGTVVFDDAMAPRAVPARCSTSAAYRSSRSTSFGMG